MAHSMSLTKEVILPGNVKVFLRPIAPRDLNSLKFLFDSLSEPTRLFGSFLVKPDMTPHEIVKVMQAENEFQMKFVAKQQGSKNPSDIIGIGGYERICDEFITDFVVDEFDIVDGGFGICGSSDIVEVSIVVAKTWQHQGLIRTLFEHISNVAKAKGFSYIKGEVVGDNATLTRLVKDIGSILKSQELFGVQQFTIRLK